MIIIIIITGSPAGLIPRNGVSHSSAKTWNFNPPYVGGNIYGSFDIFVFFILHKHIPVNRFSCTIAQKTWSREDLLWMRHVSPLKWVWMSNYQPNKMSDNVETVRDTLTMSMNHDYKTRVALSDSANKTGVKRPLQEVIVALSESVIKIRAKRPPSAKSRWNHIRLAKPRYLGNRACQIKSYYGTLSGSHGPSFRIRLEKAREAPPGGELTMTSYPVGNTTSLSRKPYMPDKKLLWNAIRKYRSLFHNPIWKCACSSPWRRTDDDAISSWQKNLVVLETMHRR